jgi:zinc/manganese transport system substrate-binding protein
LLEPFQLPFVQRGLIELLILAVPAGILGTWIVLRGLAFFSHAVGTATFPGLVLADGLGFAAPLGAFGAAVAFSAGVSTLGRKEEADSGVALVLAGCLAAGVILASDVFGSGANVETLLFGSLLLVDGGDIALAAVAAVATVVVSLLLGHRWLAGGFDPAASKTLRAGSPLLDVVLLGAIALATTAALSVIGALLVAALFVVPALTARLFVRRMFAWQLASIILVAVEGIVGLWLSVETDAPPGATIAVVSGAAFALAAAGQALARSRRKPLLAGAVLIAVGLFTAGCGTGTDAREGQVEVMATTTQLGDLVAAVGGSAVAVDQILQPNTDPHEYEPRPSDIAGAAGAQLVFASGDGLDEWIGEVVSDSGSDAAVVDLGAVVPRRLPGETSGEEASRFDPHWWHDPRNVEAAVGEIERRLAAADPDRRRIYARNAAAYLGGLRELDTRIARCVGSIPPARRKLVTDHDSFGYFADRYGIEVVGAVIPSQTTQAQPSARDLSRLADLIEREGVAAIFPESSLSTGVAEAIARQSGATVGRSLYGDTLGPSGSDGDTYLRMEQANADAIVRGLSVGRRGCKPGS